MTALRRFTLVLSLLAFAGFGRAIVDAASLTTDEVASQLVTNSGLRVETNFIWAPESLANALTTNLQARVARLRERGPALTNQLPMFTNWWFCVNGCGRNPDFWLRDCAGYTASSVWNCSSPGFMINYTALSPRHIISSGHTGCYTNHCEIHFATKDNLLVTNYVIGGLGVPNTATPSLWIGLLESNLPPSIEIARVVPTNFYSSFTAESSNRVIRAYSGVLLCCQDRWVWPTTSNFHSIRAGDSGSPMYVLIGDDLVLYGIVAGAEIVPNYGQIQYAMNALSKDLGAPRFNLSPADLSKFPTFR